MKGFKRKQIMQKLNITLSTDVEKKSIKTFVSLAKKNF